jgi:hypothetical protein
MCNLREWNPYPPNGSTGRAKYTPDSKHVVSRRREEDLPCWVLFGSGQQGVDRHARSLADGADSKAAQCAQEERRSRRKNSLEEAVGWLRGVHATYTATRDYTWSFTICNNLSRNEGNTSKPVTAKIDARMIGQVPVPLPGLRGSWLAGPYIFTAGTTAKEWTKGLQDHQDVCWSRV